MLRFSWEKKYINEKKSEENIELTAFEEQQSENSESILFIKSFDWHLKA